MNTYTNKDIENYYDQTEVHYRMFWKMEESMGLHYGIWDEGTKNIQEAIINVNKRLIELGDIKPMDVVLDAGCGIGGSSIYMAKTIGCSTKGITLSAKQVKTATALAQKKGVAGLCEFSQQDYTQTTFADNTFDVAWAIESFGSAQDKNLFFKEMHRILKPGGRIVMADTFKPTPYDISNDKTMQTMLNGWAISDISAIQEVESMAAEFEFEKVDIVEVSKEIKRSVLRMYIAAFFGMIGTKVYNLFKNASPFSKIHYTTGFAQKKAYDDKKWGYYLMAFKK